MSEYHGLPKFTHKINHQPYTSTSSYMKQKLIKLQGTIYRSVMTVADFNTFLSIYNRTWEKKISKSVEDLTNTIYQLDQTDVWRCHTTAKCAFFSNANKRFMKIYLILIHKTSFNTSKRIQAIQTMLSYHHGIKLYMGKSKNIWKLNNRPLNNLCVR